MKYRKKSALRLPTVFLAFALLLLGFMLPGYTETDDFFRYELLENGNAVIVGYEGFAHTLSIPGELDGHMVEAVGTTAFYRNGYIREITVAGSICRIEKDAFADCPNLKTVKIGKGAGMTIGESAFAGCELLRTLELGEGVTLLDDFAFQNCVRLQAVKIPASVETLGYHAFAGCESLVMDTSLSPLAAEYAVENHIDTEFSESNSFLWLEIGGGTLIGLLIVFAVWKILRRRKK